MLERHYPQNKAHIRYDPDIISGDPRHVFEIKNPTGNKTVHGPSKSVTFEPYKQWEFAVKCYQRRGLIARILQNHYSGFNYRHSRMWDELNMLDRLWNLNLPVPRPVAARCSFKNHLFYSGELITLRVPQAPNLRDMLQSSEIDLVSWYQVGHTVRSFHDQGVYHNDLNASNILIRDAETVYLLDFDKCKFRSHARGWKAANLGRLYQSLLKSKQKFKGFHFNRDDWTALIAGYGALL